MDDGISTGGPQRPRVRRGLGVLVGVALMATPLALAPVAQAAPVEVRASPDLVQQILALVEQILEGLGHLLSTPLGEQAPNTTSTCSSGYADGVGSVGTCAVSALQGSPGRKAKATIKATMRSGKVRSLHVAR